MITECYKREFYPIPGYDHRYYVSRNGVVVDSEFNIIPDEISPKTYRRTFILDGKPMTYNQIYQKTFWRGN